MRIFTLYLISFASALFFSVVLTPVMRAAAVRLKILDHPVTSVKTHKEPVPYLGGLAIWFSFIFSLIIVRLFTHFPTGTLRSLRGILFGSLLIVMVGIVDDLHIKGVHFSVKFLIQFAAALILVFFGIKIKFITPEYAAVILTFVWVIGITNAFNIVDVMDGLSGSIGIIASAAFFFISLPTEELYVNFAAIVLAGACVGFLPYNLSKRYRIFLGDTGSLLIGFILSALALGTSYTSINSVALFAPIMILALPIYDTVLVSCLRLKRNRSPFIGSKDHFALRLQQYGFSKIKVLLISILVCAGLALSAYASTKTSLMPALVMYVIIIALFFAAGIWLSKIKMES